MGTTYHHAIVATTNSPEALGALAHWVNELKKPEDSSIDPKRLIFLAPPTVNDMMTVTLVPDGSNEGWPQSNWGDSLRSAFKKFLRKSHSWTWVEVGYGEGTTMIMDSYDKNTTPAESAPGTAVQNQNEAGEGNSNYD